MNNAARIKIAVQELRLARSSEMGPVYFHGETMRPFMGEGDLAIVEPVEWDDIHVGDIITYRFEDKFPTRRVAAIDRRAGMLTLRGDSIPGLRDYVVERRDVLGRVTAREREGVRIDRQSMEWRTATWRAIAAQRFAELSRTGRWLVRAVWARLTGRRFRRVRR